MIIHIAGPAITIDNQQRQRCAWCGAVLLEYDLYNIAVPVGQDPRPATWPVGELVASSGNAAWIVERKAGDRLPEGACGRLPAVKRCIVLGLSVEAEAWRKGRGLSPRDVVIVSPAQYTGALRGLSGDFEMIELDSWSKATARVRDLVERDLEIIRATQLMEGWRPC